MDAPGARKVQARPVPLLGGVAIALGLLAGGLALPGLLPALKFAPAAAAGGQILRGLIGGALLLGVGLLDDRRGLGPRLRLVAQALAALLFWPELLGWGPPAWLALPLGLIWVVGLINSLNFLDNMDAAAGSTALWTALALGLLFALGGAPLLGAAAWLLAASLCGFLIWNLPPARLYMGDAGSTLLGYGLATLTLVATGRELIAPALAPLLLAVPIYDTCTVLWIRWREGRALWVGDRRHATHRLQARGASVTRAVLTLNAWTLLGAALALGLTRATLPAWTGLAAGVGAALLLFAWERGAEARR